MFKNREDAGQKIAEAIKEYRLSDQNVKDILNSYSEIMEESA